MLVGEAEKCTTVVVMAELRRMVKTENEGGAFGPATSEEHPDIAAVAGPIADEFHP
jgi:hypothetical protein